MKLTVHRSQTADSQGVIRFIAKFKLEVSSEELGWIMKYARKDLVIGKVDPICPGAAVDAFMSGRASYGSDNLSSVLAVEKQVTEDVQAFAALMAIASNYEGIEELFLTE